MIRRRLWKQVLAAMVLLLSLVLGLLILGYQHVTAINFGIYQNQRNRMVHHHMVGLLAKYYVHHGNSFIGVQSLLAPMSGLAPGPVEIISTHGHIVGGTTPPGPVLHAMRRHLPIQVGNHAVGQLVWSAAPHPEPLAIPVGFLSMMNHSLIMVTLIALVVAIILSYGMARSIVRPVETLTEAAQQIASGNRLESVNIARQDEIGALGDAFNQMVHHLQIQNRLRETLVDDVAHELRHPLTHIQGYLEAMLDDKIPLSKDHVTTLYHETQHLNRMVGDLHRLAQVQAGTMVLSQQWYALDAVVEQVITMLQPYASKTGGVQLEMEGARDWPKVYIDPVRTREILDNVVRNAIQHSRPGAWVLIRGTANDDCVQLQVQDFGEGIPLDAMPHIFSRFFRIDSARSRAKGGVGLGLAIAQHLVQRQGGNISVRSRIGQGSTFTLTFPRRTS